MLENNLRDMVDVPVGTDELMLLDEDEQTAGFPHSLLYPEPSGLKGNTSLSGTSESNIGRLI